MDLYDDEPVWPVSHGFVFRPALPGRAALVFFSKPRPSDRALSDGPCRQLSQIHPPIALRRRAPFARLQVKPYFIYLYSSPASLAILGVNELLRLRRDNKLFSSLPTANSFTKYSYRFRTLTLNFSRIVLKVSALLSQVKLLEPLLFPAPRSSR
jgi:hypothetical protein